MRKIMSIPAVALFIAMAANADTPQSADAVRGTIDEDPNTAYPTPTLKPLTIGGEGAPAWQRSDVATGDWFAVQRAEAKVKDAETRVRALAAKVKGNERAIAEAKSRAEDYQSKLTGAEDEADKLRDKVKGTEDAVQVAVNRYKRQIQIANAQEQVIDKLTASLTDRIKFRDELNGQSMLIILLGIICVVLWLHQRDKFARILHRIPNKETEEVISRLENDLTSKEERLQNVIDTGNKLLRDLQAKEDAIKRLQASGRGVLRDKEALQRTHDNLLTEIGQLRQAFAVANDSLELHGGERIPEPPAVTDEPEIAIVHHEPQDPPPSDPPVPAGEVPPDPSAPKPVAPEDDATTRYSASDANQPAGTDAEPPIQPPAPDAVPQPLISPEEAATRRLFDTGDHADAITQSRETMHQPVVLPPPGHVEAQTGDEGCDDGPGARHRQ